MMRSLGGRARAKRHRNLNPSLESLESRLALSRLAGGAATFAESARTATAPTTVTMPAEANGMIGGVATHRMMVIRGQTLAGARVHLKIRNASRVTRAGVLGNYQFRVAMPPGSYDLEVRAVNRAGIVSSASMTTTQGDAVIAWINTMIDVIRADPSNVGLASRTMAMVSAAVYDAVNDIERTHAVFKVDVRAPHWASPQAAASAAAYTVLSALYPDMTTQLETTMAQSLAAVPAGPARNVGVDVGREVANGILAWRANDGSAVSVPYVPGHPATLQTLMVTRNTSLLTALQLSADGQEHLSRADRRFSHDRLLRARVRSAWARRICSASNGTSASRWTNRTVRLESLSLSIVHLLGAKYPFISPSPTVELGCRRQRQSRRVENVGQQPHVVLGFAFGRNTDQSARNRRLAFLPSVLRPVENGAFAPGLEFHLLYRTGLWRFYLIFVVFSPSNSALGAGRRTLGASCVQTHPCLRRLWLCSQHALAGLP